MQRLGLNKNIKPVIFITSEGSKKPRQVRRGRKGGGRERGKEGRLK